MVREGIPFVAIPALLAVALLLLGWWVVAVPFVLVAAFMVYFFRDPHREVPTEPGLVVSAADGRVTRIDEDENGRCISVFLSPLDVHVNRSPVTGVIGEITYTRGRKMPATSDEASFVNERNSLLIDSDVGDVTCTQIAGILTRRIVCWPKTGDNLEHGQRFGMIKFSSRTDVRMPHNVEILVKIGDRVRGGETVIAMRSEQS